MLSANFLEGQQPGFHVIDKKFDPIHNLLPIFQLNGHIQNDIQLTVLALRWTCGIMAGEARACGDLSGWTPLWVLFAMRSGAEPDRGLRPLHRTRCEHHPETVDAALP